MANVLCLMETRAVCSIVARSGRIKPFQVNIFSVVCRFVSKRMLLQLIISCECNKCAKIGCHQILLLCYIVGLQFANLF